MLVFSPAMAQREDVGNRFVLAYLRGVRDYVDAFKKGRNREALVQLLIEAKILNSAQQADEPPSPQSGRDHKEGRES